MPETNPAPETPRNPDVSYERSDAAFKGVLIGGGVLVVVAVFFQVLVAWLYGYYQRKEEKAKPPLSPLTAEERRQLPRDIDEIGQPWDKEKVGEPRLQVEPVYDMDEMRKEEDRALASYGWANKESGLVRVPIEQAMGWLADPKKAKKLGIEVRPQNKQER
jgi:hypothetical protein